MKLFFREHLPLFALQVVQLFMVLLVYWLDGYRNLPTALYSVFIGLIILSGYLAYRYVTHRRLYRRLTEPLETLDESSRLDAGYAPLARAVDELLQTQYRHYQHKLNVRERQRNDHLTFMNQWVHQMKTPLSVIHLTLQQDDDHDPKYSSIREEVERLEQGLETVLHAARLEAFEHDFQVEPVNLRRAVDQVIRDNKRMFIRSSVYPEVSLDPSLTVESDAKWLAFILFQLLTNAVKYSSSKANKVYITGGIQGKRVMLEIRDQGIGIPKSDLKRVFQPFFTGENGRLYRESTGMGLYLVQEICRRLDHKVELESSVNQGTTVRLLFTGSPANLTEM
ncbi:sensor histidine kinase [Paenibacillus sambharensis]|uniref:histidine kinase n=1 Tax=Paenibacillus sambharensis TaxID=1803190 RepID=A0A2W1LRL9_9BACL|nr:sensor histidine kinase [Paenibacillus sambharensis]PZD97622.1 sensor histidine kinase [Paenibacillus sambharensis]